MATYVAVLGTLGIETMLHLLQSVIKGVLLGGGPIFQRGKLQGKLP